MPYNRTAEDIEREICRELYGTGIPYHPISEFARREEDDEERARRLRRDREWHGAA